MKNIQKLPVHQAPKSSKSSGTKSIAEVNEAIASRRHFNSGSIMGGLAVSAFAAVALLSSSPMTGCKTTITEPVPYAVHDTTRDTTHQHDTLIVRDTIHLHDTLPAVHDTIIVTKHDTIITHDTLPAVHDTTIVNHTDTIIVTKTVHDTTVIHDPIFGGGNSSKHYLMAAQVVHNGVTTDLVIGPDSVDIGGGMKAKTINGGRNQHGGRVTELLITGTNGTGKESRGTFRNGTFADAVSASGTDTVRIKCLTNSKGITSSQVPIEHLQVLNNSPTDSLVDLLNVPAGTRTATVRYVKNGVINTEVVTLVSKDPLPADSLSQATINGTTLKVGQSLQVTPTIHVRLTSLAVQDTSNPIIVNGTVTDSIGVRDFSVHIFPGGEATVRVARDSRDSARTNILSISAPSMDMAHDNFEAKVEVRDSVGNSAAKVVTPSTPALDLMGVPKVDVQEMVDPSEGRARKGQNGPQ